MFQIIIHIKEVISLHALICIDFFGLTSFKGVSMFVDHLTPKPSLDMKSGWLVVLVLWHINLSGLFNAKSIFMQIVSSISNNSA